jgi:hypothetical protein
LDPADRSRDRRATFLSAVFTVLVLGAILAGLLAACGGLTLYAAAAAVGVALLGFLHYLIWGHALSEQVAAERAGEEFGEPIEPAEGPGPDDPESRRW